MITDIQTNFLYLADTLQKKYPAFFRGLQIKLAELEIPHSVLVCTKDVWAVDYMPIQIALDRFVQFVYNPDYLRKYQKWRKTISDVPTICKLLLLNPESSDIILDGGNVVKSAYKVIMCDKVFKENPNYSRQNLITALENHFEVDKLIFIPTDSTDIIGHADGVVRFIEEDTVVINRYSGKDAAYARELKLSLSRSKLNYIEVPYNPYANAAGIAANGIYINYLQMRQGVLVPTFGMKEDEIALRQFEQLFIGQKICAVDSKDIAKDGGVLNCISWNILTNYVPSV